MTEASVSAYDKFIEDSAEQYIHTVVLVDDKIYERKSGSVVSNLTKPAARFRKAALKSASTTANTSDEENTQVKEFEKPDEVSFHDIQNSFAKKGIICSLYQPNKTASFGEKSDVYKLCSTADVVIVDWDLHGDSGGKVMWLNKQDTPVQFSIS